MDNNIEKKHSMLGIISFGISIAVGVLMLALFVVGGILYAHRAPQSRDYPGQMMVGFAGIFLMAADLVAVGLGIAALFEGERKRVFGIIGLALSVGTIVGSVGLIIVGLMVGSK